MFGFKSSTVLMKKISVAVLEQGRRFIIRGGGRDRFSVPSTISPAAPYHIANQRAP